MLYERYHAPSKSRWCTPVGVLLLVSAGVGIFLCLPFLFPPHPLNEITGLELIQRQDQLQHGQWMVAYYLPTSAHERWAGQIWRQVLEEIEIVGLDVDVLSVKTRPEFHDFGRRFDILDWPTIEMYHDGMVHRFVFPGGDKNCPEEIIRFASGGWRDEPAMRKSDLRRRAL